MTSLLFVCTGNTCRSPLAEALVRREVQTRRMEVSVSSAGTRATAGVPASPLSVLAASRRGADLSAHRSRPLDPELLRGADLVLAMTQEQLRVLRTEGGRELSVGLVTDFLPPAHDHHGRAVPDPFGGDEAEYEAVADLLDDCVAPLLDWLAASG